MLASILAASSCGDDRAENAGGGTVVFGLFLDPFTLDGALAGGNTPTFMAVSQIFETLTTLDPDTAQAAPGLARSWDTADGTTWSFELQPDVSFHDGTDLDAEAVCFNFERWYHFTGILQKAAEPWGRLFGFADTGAGAPETLYRACEAPADDEVVLRLSRPYGSMPAELAYPAFSIASPDALRRYDADRIGGTSDAPVFDSPFGERHPVGTGPFRFRSWTRNEKLEVVRNDEYWGEAATVERVIFRPIKEGTARRQALESGDIDGYAPVDAGDLEPLRSDGFTLLELPAANVGTVGLNIGMPPLDKLQVRQAVAHALNREALVTAKFPRGTEVATQLVPPSLPGHSADVPTYRYDPALARRLLQESGVADPTVEFWYPVQQGEPLHPDTEGMFLAFKADLEAVGFTVVGKPAPARPDYYATLPTGQMQMFLFADYSNRASTADLFRPFAKKQPTFGLDEPRLFDALLRATTEVDPARLATLYQEANRLVMEALPVVPIAHVKTAFALSPRLRGFRVGPGAFDPDFSAVTFGDRS